MTDEQHIFNLQNSEITYFGEATAGGAARNGDPQRRIPNNENPNEIDEQAWRGNQVFNSFGEAFGTECLQNEEIPHDWIVSDAEKAAAMLEENTAHAVDYSHQATDHDHGWVDGQGNRLDGPVPSNIAAEEAHAGQLAYCTDASSGYGCDGNRISNSLAKHSNE